MSDTTFPALAELPRLTTRLIAPPPLAKRDTVSGMLSVIIPAYNVENYIDAALDSLLAQTGDFTLDVIVIDDGSMDGTLDILQDRAAGDDRISILHAPHGGPNAARNVGIAAARGEFLTFFDSDDILLPGAYERAVSSLRNSGSDFAVAGYTRLDGDVQNPAAHWIQRAHKHSRSRVTIQEFPAILVNAVQWTKVYRRSFWDEHVQFFSEPGFYQDQLVSARAFGSAQRFDVVHEEAVAWRRRDDRSSMTQHAHAVANLSDRFRTAFESLAILRALAGDATVAKRLVQFMNHDFPHSAHHLPGTDDAFWIVLVDGIRRGLALAERYDVKRKIMPQHKVLFVLIAQNRREDAESFMAQGGRDVGKFEMTLGAGMKPIVKLPFYRDPTVPRWAFHVTSAQIGRGMAQKLGR